MPEEHAPLGKLYVTGFAESDPAYPILARAMDPREPGYAGIVPAVGTAPPEANYTATHVFTHVQQTVDDRRVLWIYEKLAGPTMKTHIVSSEVRGRTLEKTVQKGLNGTLAPETGNGIISSETVDLTSGGTEQRTTIRFASDALPPDEVYAYWDFVAIPTLLFSITNTIYCNNSSQWSVTTAPVKAGGSSQLRKHRVTVQYHNAYPEPNLTSAAIVPANIEYLGKAIRFSYSNVLNDAISYDEDFYNNADEGTCFWTEAYDFAASSPSATTFAAGAWYLKEYDVQPFGVSGFRSRKVEFYSIAANPAVVP